MTTCGNVLQMLKLHAHVDACRVCGDDDFVVVYDFGHMALTGKFPRVGDEAPTAPMTVIQCMNCACVQLLHNYNPAVLYNDGYGYRSGLNASMVAHLGDVVRMAKGYAALEPGDVVVDIGSNDGTLLNAVGGEYRRIGIDPLSTKYAEFYDDDIVRQERLFSADAVTQVTNRKAKLITSIAMLYDLADPVAFARQVASVLHDDGVWITEQADLCAMVGHGAYDSICHEHLLYLTVHDLENIVRQAGLVLLDVRYNDVNGGSFIAVVGHATTHVVTRPLGTAPTLDLVAFARHIAEHPRRVHDFFDAYADAHIVGFGASTKGNVVLQHCDIRVDDIPCIVDVNEDKWGCTTPRTGIPIVEKVDTPPDYYLALPWHFKDYFLRSNPGQAFAFLLPEIEIGVVR